MSFFKQIRSIIAKAAPVAVPERPPEPAPAAAIPSEPVERRSRKRLNTHKGRRVLIVDDSPTIIAVLKKVLRSAGCITIEALDAEQGLEMVRKEKPDLVFLDIVLPGMNGFAALRLMRRDPATHHIPVIMISGNEQATEQFYAKRIGADDFMKKPFSRFEVFARIDSLVELNKLAALKASVMTERPAALRATPATVVATTSATASTTTPAAAAPATTPRPAANVVSLPVPPAGLHLAPPAAPRSAPPPPRRPEILPIPASAAPTHEIAPQKAPRPLAPVAVSPPAMTPLEARSQLTAMGLQYFNQEQFLAAIQRGDKLALELFIAGGGVDINV